MNLASDHVRVLILSSEFPPGPGGIGNHACHLAKELTLNGCEVLVLTPQEFVSAETSAAFNQTQGFRIHTLHQGQHTLSKAISRYRVLNRQICEFKPDILIASGSHSVWLAAASAPRHRVPWMAVGHGSEFSNLKNLGTAITRHAFNKADCVIFVSHFTRQVAHEAGITPRAEMVIHNGADGHFFKPGSAGVKQKIAAQMGFTASDPLLLTVGNLTRRKGQEVVISALPEVLQNFPNARYLMAGLPTEKERLSQLAAALGVKDRVTFLGNIDSAHLLELYQACDIFLMTSQRCDNGDVEGFGISVIEAALCGKPAIVSADSGLAEAVEDGITGICVPEKDPHAAADAIIRLILDEPLRHRLGRQALERAAQAYTWQTVGKAYFHEITRLLGLRESTP